MPLREMRYMRRRNRAGHEAKTTPTCRDASVLYSFFEGTSRRGSPPPFSSAGLQLHLFVPLCGDSWKSWAASLAHRKGLSRLVPILTLEAHMQGTPGRSGKSSQNPDPPPEDPNPNHTRPTPSRWILGRQPSRLRETETRILAASEAARPLFPYYSTSNILTLSGNTLGLGTPGRLWGWAPRDTLGLGTPGMSEPGEEKSSGRGEEFRARVGDK